MNIVNELFSTTIKLLALMTPATVLSTYLSASISIYCMLRCAEKVEKLIGPVGLTVLSKLTGLLLAAIAAQEIATGCSNFFKNAGL